MNVLLRSLTALGFALCLACSSSDRTEEADAAAGDAPTAPELIQEANTAIGEENWDAAVDKLEAAVEQAPESPLAWILLARARRGAGDLEGSLAAAEKATEFPPARGAALQQRFLTVVASGDLDRAVELYEELRTTPVVDFSGLHTSGELEPLRDDERFAMLFPSDFDDAFVEGERIIHDWHGEGPGEEFGWEARAVGDIDGDGVVDALVSAPGNQPGADASGAVYVYSGHSGELLWKHRGEPGDQLGMGIETAGDVDGDGGPDVVVGAPGAGRTFIYSGRDGHTLLTVEAAEDDGPSYGAKVAGCGDLDGDGHDDFVVGAQSAEGGAGRVYLHSGADGSVLQTYEGTDGQSLGSTVAGGDGMVVVGAANAGEGNRGRIWVYRGVSGEAAFTFDAEESGQQLGGMFASVLGDVDGDGVPDVYASDWQDGAEGPVTGRIYVHSGADGKRLYTIAGEAAGDGFGIGPARAGDVDGDGHADLVVGAWQHGSAAHSGGKIYVYSGADGTLLDTYTGKIPGETLGFDADGMGDVDGDGHADFLVTSAWSLVAGPRSGRTLVVSGAPVGD